MTVLNYVGVGFSRIVVRKPFRCGTLTTLVDRTTFGEGSLFLFVSPLGNPKVPLVIMEIPFKALSSRDDQQEIPVISR